MRHLDYDEIAPVYDQRYEAAPREGSEGVIAALRRLTGYVGARRVLEAGCGTELWLGALQETGPDLYGLDLSAGMLAKARERSGKSRLVRGTASRLPFVGHGFDVVFAVNALHHFDDPVAFVTESRRVLRRGGALVVIGMDPHAGRDRWYLYDYFEGTFATDLERGPSAATIADWMRSAGFGRAEIGTAHHPPLRRRVLQLEQVVVNRHRGPHGCIMMHRSRDANVRPKPQARLGSVDPAEETLVPGRRVRDATDGATRFDPTPPVACV